MDHSSVDDIDYRSSHRIPERNQSKGFVLPTHPVDTIPQNMDASLSFVSHSLRLTLELLRNHTPDLGKMGFL